MFWKHEIFFEINVFLFTFISIVDVRITIYWKSLCTLVYMNKNNKVIIKMRNANFGNLEQIYTNKQYFEQLKSDKSKLYWYGKSKPRGNMILTWVLFYTRIALCDKHTHTKPHIHTCTCTCLCLISTFFYTF